MQDALDLTAQGTMGVVYYLQYRCKSGHTFEVQATEKANHCVTIVLNDADTLRSKLHIINPTIVQYLDHAPPRSRLGNSYNGTTVLHRLPHTSCSHQSCASQAGIVAIRTAWPDILRILTTDQNRTLNTALDRSVKLSSEFSLTQHGQDGTTIDYEVVGCVRHQPGGVGHWYAYLNISGSCYRYDDLERGGEYVHVADDLRILETAHGDNVMFVYRRSSATKV